MGIYCSHLSSHLVGEDPRLSIYGPVIMNAELLAYQGELEEVRTLGVGQQRQYLKKLAQEAYPQIETVQEINPRMLAYSLEMGLIDGAVVDVTKASLLPECSFAPLADRDYISYVLVVRNDIVDTPAFAEFVEGYNAVIQELAQTQSLREHTGLGEADVERLPLRFLPLDPP